MSLVETPICDFDTPAIDFSLPGTDGKTWTLSNVQGTNGLLVMFICNHCPYVQAIRANLMTDTKELIALGIGCVAIMSNDVANYPDDSFENMKVAAEEYQYPFPYLFDESQEVAKAYGAVCTPDFFGYNNNLKLQYRGRFDNRVMKDSVPDAERELLHAMKGVAETGKGPLHQTPSMGCSIKWKKW